MEEGGVVRQLQTSTLLGCNSRSHYYLSCSESDVSLAR